MNPTPQSSYRSRVSPLHIIIQLIALGALFASWRSGHHAAAIACAAVIVFFVAVLPRIVKRAEARFQKQAIALLTSGRAEAVISLARRQIMLQLFGATAPVDARLGLALCERERYAEAIPCLENALSRAPDVEVPALIAALVRARLVVGDPVSAEKEGRNLIDKRGIRIGETALLVARARIAQNKRDPMTQSYLQIAAELCRSTDELLMLELTRIEWDLLNERRPTDIPADADSRRRFIQIWTHYVRGRIREHRGHVDDALKSYARAAALADGTRIWFADLAREKVDALGKSMIQAASEKLETAHSTDERRRRKRKRR